MMEVSEDMEDDTVSVKTWVTHCPEKIQSVAVYDAYNSKLS